MATWYYYNESGEKVGPICTRELKQLIQQGTILPNTMLEDGGGRAAVAEKWSGLTFLEDVFPPIPAVPEVNEQTPPRLSRAVFIFLAVFVGLFGVHDFYAKRVREGGIHLALLLPWILAIFVSILGVFGMTLYVLAYSPLRKEIRECQRDIKDVEKEIKTLEEKIQGKKLEIRDARAGRLRRQRPLEPQPQRQVEPQPQPQPQRQFEPQPQPQRQVEPQPQPQREFDLRDVDHEFVRELENSLQELEGSLEDLEQYQLALQGDLANLRAKQGAEKIPAWVSVGPLWLYFFFGILPFASWVMAMFEIVYVTKDGTGRPLCF